MSKRPTPETDANEAWPASKLRLGNDSVVPSEFARRLERERDEVREIAQQLIHIASHCLGWHDNQDPQRITEAIKRWKVATQI